MKKIIIVIILSLISISSFGQNKWYNIYQDNDIKINALQKEGYMHLTIYNKCSGEGISKFYFMHKISVGCKFTDFVNNLIFAKNKWEEYDKISTENNIDKVDKIIKKNIYLGTQNSTWGSGSVWANLKYFKDNDKSNIIIEGIENYGMGMYYGVKLEFENINILNEIINILSDYDNILNITSEYTKNNNLFN